MSQPGVLLVNLGTPDSTDVEDVRSFLKEFLTDPYVLGGVWPFRQALVRGIIAPVRGPKASEAYKLVWTEAGSPIMLHSLALKERLAEAMPDRRVALAMRYQNPSITSVLEELDREGVHDLIVVSLFPQHSSSTSTTTIKRVEKVARQISDRFRLRFVRDFYEHPGFIDAQAALAKTVIDEVQPDKVIMSYHGVPEDWLRKDDETGSHCLWSKDCCAEVKAENRYCYRAQCLATSRALASPLGLAEDRYESAFQSRFGPKQWTRPYTDYRVRELAEAGAKKLVVLCPAFVADCLETLEEIAIGLDEIFQEAGGERLRAVPCVNASPLWVQGLETMIREREAIED